MEENENNNNNSKKEEKINDLENNIEDKNIFYQNYQNDAENYYENKKLKEIEARKTEIRLFYYSILELFTKKQYKKIIELFEMKDEELENDKENEKDKDKEDDSENKENKITYQTEWIFSFLHLVSIERVIKKKVSKNQKKTKMINIKKYLDKENKILNIWFSLINEMIKERKKSKEDIQCFLEFSIEFILNKCINLARYCISLENIKVAIYYLSLGIYLINHSYKFFKSPKSYCLSAELLIYLTSILIADNKYDTAKNMISFSIKLLYISLEVILLSNSEHLSYTIFDILSQKKQNIEPIIKTIFYISISFYHLGICYENQGDNYSAYYAYKQSKFFLSIIKELDDDIYTFYDFISDVESRQLLRNRLIIFFRKYFKSNQLMETEEAPKIKIYNPFIMNKKKKEEKFMKLEEYISNMKLIDIDNDDPHLFDKIDKQFKPNVKFALKQVHLFDYLMSDEFKKIINKMKKIQINKLNYETIHLIQRQIINIKNNEREKLSKQFQDRLKNKSNNKKINNKNINSKTINTVPSSITFNSGKKTRVSSGYKNNNQTLFTDVNTSDSLFFLRSRPATAQNERFKSHRIYNSKYIPAYSLNKRSLSINNSKNNIKFDLKYNIQKQKYLSYRKNISNYKRTIPKYSYDKYLFNKSFMNKKKNLEKQYSNELNFQKKLLKCKEKENSKPDPYNLKKVQTDCEEFFSATFDKEMMKIREKKYNFGNDYIKNIVRKKFRMVYNANKAINEFRKTKKFTHFMNNKENNEKDIEENNYKFINSLMRDIDQLNEKEKSLKKTYRKRNNLIIQTE